MEDADSGSQRARILRVATRCISADQFVEAFARFCDGRTLFVSSLSTRPIGTRLPFAILLADGTRAMRGQCEVIESYATPGNAYRRPGVKLALAELDDESEEMLTRLQVARAARDARNNAVLAASAAAAELPGDGHRPPPTLPSLPPPPPGSPARAAASLAPLTRPGAARLPALPPLPRLQGGPAEPRRVDPLPPLAVEPSRRPAVVLPPPPTDETDAGWGDDGDNRPGRTPTVPPVAAADDEPVAGADEPVAAASDELAAVPDSSPAMIVSPIPDAAAAAAAAASDDPMDGVPVVELTQRSGRNRRATDGVARERASTASGRVADRGGRYSTTGGVSRPTPGDVYSPEERTPGSSFILPANPLSNLTDESLQGFIDCTIYEDPNANPPAPVDELATSDPAISGSALGMVEEPEPDFRPIAAPAPVIEPAPTPSVVIDAAMRERQRRITGSMSGEISIPRTLASPHARAVSQPLASIDEDEDEDELLPPAVAPAAVVVAPTLTTPVAAPATAPDTKSATATGAPPAKAETKPPPSGAVPGQAVETKPGQAVETKPGKAVETKPAKSVETKPGKAVAATAATAATAAAKAAETKPAKPDVLVTHRVRARTSRATPPPLTPSQPLARDDRSAPDWLSTGTPAASPRMGTKPAPRKPASRRELVAVLLLVAIGAVVTLYLRHRGRSAGATRPSGGVARGRDASVATDAAIAGSTPGSGTTTPATPIDAGPAAVQAMDAGVAESGDCHLQVTTTPAGAVVTLSKRALGPSPIDVAVDCGPATLSARMPRFVASTRQLTLAPGTPTVVNVKLVRPTHHLTVLSTPKGATVWIDGKPVGVTPLRSFAVSGFTRHTLTIELTDYTVHRTSITADEEEQTVAVPLIKGP